MAYVFLFDYPFTGNSVRPLGGTPEAGPMGVSKGLRPLLRASGVSVSGGFDRDCLNSVLSALKCFILPLKNGIVCNMALLRPFIYLIKYF